MGVGEGRRGSHKGWLNTCSSSCNSCLHYNCNSLSVSLCNHADNILQQTTSAICCIDGDGDDAHGNVIISKKCVCVRLSLSLCLSVSTVFFRFLDCYWLQHLPSHFCFLACIGNFYTQIIVCTGSSSRRRRTISMATAAGGSCTQLLQQQKQQEVFFFFNDSRQCALIKTDQITLFDNIYNRDFIITTSRESITKDCSQISAAKRNSCKERRRWWSWRRRGRIKVCESSFSFSTNSTQQEYQSLRSMYKVQRVSWKDLCQIIPLSLETESASHHVWG